MTAATPIIEMRDIDKAFGAVQALKDVNLRLMPGEILGLVGDNSAGKSTLMKVLTGAYNRDSGDVLVDGARDAFQEPARQPRPRHRDDLPGLRACAGTWTSAQNIFLGRWPRKLGLFVDRERMYADAERGAEAAQGRRQLGLPEGREPVGRAPAIRRHRPRHLLRPARRHPRRADRQPLRHGDRAPARDDGRAEAPGRRADHHLATA